MLAHMSRRHTILWWTLAIVIVGLVVFLAVTPARGGDREPTRDELALGRELFLREWVANDSRSHGGDGLGPVFNDSSCVACHNQGGTGGAGPVNKNVDIVSVFLSPDQTRTNSSFPASVLRSAVVIPGISPKIAEVRKIHEEAKIAEEPKINDEVKQKQLLERLVEIHPGFRAARSVVLHRFGTQSKYEPWRSKLTGLGSRRVEVDDEDELVNVKSKPNLTQQQAVIAEQQIKERQNRQAMSLRRSHQSSSRRGNFRGSPRQHGEFSFVTTQRNTTALFGVGLIDSIPDAAIEAGAEVKHSEFPKIRGRVSRLADGKIGRFGWKAQKASLREFAMTACAIELGLQVPEHQQAGLGYKPDYKAPGLDMNLKECDTLVSFLKKLPAPVQHLPATAAEVKYLQGGRDLFASTGCAACHTPQLAKVDGIYSDLLLHDLGPELGDTGSYGAFTPGSSTEDISGPIPQLSSSRPGSRSSSVANRDGDPQKKIIGAMRQEWRTSPLWGVRDSGPYLHDGRADTLEQAVAFHGGEAEESTLRYFALSNKLRLQLTSFLKSLTAPEQIASSRP